MRTEWTPEQVSPTDRGQAPTAGKVEGQSIIAPDDPGLEAARDYAFNLGLSVDPGGLRWIIEAYLEEHEASIERNRLSADIVETRIVSPWRAV